VREVLNRQGGVSRCITVINQPLSVSQDVFGGCFPVGAIAHLTNSNE
jgi:hypothetical protein